MSSDYPPVLFANRGVDPPASVYITQDEVVSITVYTATGGFPILITARILGTDGEVHWMQWQEQVPASPGFPVVFTLNLMEGFLLGLTVSNQAGGVGRGTCYIQAALGVGTGAQHVPLDVLFSDYLNSQTLVGFPRGGNRGSTDQAGAQVVVATGAGGASPITFTFPTKGLYLLTSMEIPITTNATAGNRTAQISLSPDGSHITFRATAQTQQAASTTVLYEVGQGLPTQATTTGTPNGIGYLALPNAFYFLPGGTIRVDIAGAVAGDTIGTLAVNFQQWVRI